jgi:hypothetical protein
MPMRARSSTRRGDALARMSFIAGGLAETIGDAPLGQVIRRHFNKDFVASQNANAVLAQLAGSVADNLMFVFKADAKRGVGQQFYDSALKFEQFFF